VQEFDEDKKNSTKRKWSLPPSKLRHYLLAFSPTHQFRRYTIKPSRVLLSIASFQNVAHVQIGELIDSRCHHQAKKLPAFAVEESPALTAVADPK
jgi:hypothetical protein